MDAIESRPSRDFRSVGATSCQRDGLVVLPPSPRGHAPECAYGGRLSGGASWLVRVARFEDDVVIGFQLIEGRTDPLRFDRPLTPIVRNQQVRGSSPRAGSSLVNEIDGRLQAGAWHRL